VQRLLTDNGSPYLSHAFRDAAASRGIGHLRTRPYRPRTNGKAEAFVKIVQDGWAYKRPYASTAERIAALPGFLAYYKGYRPHGGLDGDTPLAGSLRQKPRDAEQLERSQTRGQTPTVVIAEVPAVRRRALSHRTRLCPPCTRREQALEPLHRHHTPCG